MEPYTPGCNPLRAFWERLEHINESVPNAAEKWEGWPPEPFLVQTCNDYWPAAETWLRENDRKSAIADAIIARMRGERAVWEACALIDFLKREDASIWRVRAERLARASGRDGADGADSAAEAPKGDGAAGKNGMSKEDKALAVLVRHPTWTNKQIAEQADCNPSGMCRMKRFKAARAALKGGRQDVVRGSKDREGNVEATD